MSHIIPSGLEALPDQPIETNLSITDDLFVKWYCIQKAESYIPQHVHEHDHVTVIACGGVAVWVDDVYEGERLAPASLVIPAGKKHLFKTLADGTILLCIHAVDDTGEPKILREHHIVGEG